MGLRLRTDLPFDSTGSGPISNLNKKAEVIFCLPTQGYHKAEKVLSLYPFDYQSVLNVKSQLL